KKLFLVGFMATGKTTIGKRLSSRLNLPFFDSDKEIELALGYSINEYFRRYEEKKFRAVEEKVIIEKIKNNKENNFIMSLGGGAYLSHNIRELIGLIGISIWLNGNINIIYNRLKNSRNERPLIVTYNTKEKLEKLLKKRMLYYEKADIKVNIINTSKDKMSKIILNQIEEYISIKDGKNKD
ncbi:MAG: shikimate kinase, partial [Pseudomonadota bacterium]|nr:shikimate kinase [Pseudomonadota bacterium]